MWVWFHSTNSFHSVACSLLVNLLFGWSSSFLSFFLAWTWLVFLCSAPLLLLWPICFSLWHHNASEALVFNFSVDVHWGVAVPCWPNYSVLNPQFLSIICWFHNQVMSHTVSCASLLCKHTCVDDVTMKEFLWNCWLVMSFECWGMSIQCKPCVTSFSSRT